jgi:predicted O-methyltransferase YrrM
MTRQPRARHRIADWATRFARRTFGFWERLGIHLTPADDFGPIPNTRALRAETWSRSSELVGIDLRPQQQLALLDSFKDLYRREYEEFPATPQEADPHEFFLDNEFFGSVDAEVLYCMIRHFKPRRVIEIGAGFSTLLSAQAARTSKELDGRDVAVLSIDPSPQPFLRDLSSVELIEQRLEEVPLATFEELDANDILFIDSSHVLRTGGDVQYEYLEVVPRLRPGVLVHVHDVFLPAEYPYEWVMKERRFCTEQYLLQAFLAFNSEFEVLWAAGFLDMQYPSRLKEAFSSYDPSTPAPGSFWMRRSSSSSFEAD